MLKSLELSGFKSFADPTRLDFAQGISALVGPNGSGKSNIVDAIKWVLGEQSIKKLRAGDSTDVIFNGSATRPPLNSAEVTLTFTNEDRRLAVDSDEVHFTRRIYRSGESEYLINRQASRLKDFREILCGTGLGLHAYSIIEQGRVEGLLQSTSQQRRTVLEEAAGTALYRIKMQETERKLERVQLNMLRASDVVNEKESQLRNTKSQAGKAQLYRQYSTRLRELRIEVDLVGWYKNHRAMTRLTEEFQNRKDHSDDLDTEVTQGDNELFELNQEVDKHDQEIRVYTKEHAGLREKVVAEQSVRDFQVSRVKSFDEEIADEGRRLLDLKRRKGGDEDLMRQTDDDIARTTKCLQEATGSFDQGSATLHELTEKCHKLHDSIKTHENTLQGKALEESRLSGEIKGLTLRRKSLEKNRSTLQKTIERINNDISKLSDHHGRLCDDVSKYEGEAAAAQAACEALESELEKLTAEHGSLSADLSSLRLQHSAKAERHSLLEELIRKNEGHSPGVQEVLANMSNPESPFRFAHGLVANLFRVKRSFAHLIGFALGQKVEYIIVSPEPELFRYLENHSEKFAGRVGFIWLDSGPADPWGELTYKNHPGVVGRADQLVETDPIFEPVLRRLLGHTWIVKNMAVAKTLFRESDPQTDFLTLKGEHLTPDGTLIVGPRDRYTGLISRQSEFQELVQILPGMESDIADRSVTLELVENRVKDARKRRSNAANDVRKFQKKIDALQLDQKAAESRERDLHLELENRHSELHAVEDDLQQVTDDLSRCEEEKRILAEEQNSLIEMLTGQRTEYNNLEQRHREQREQTNRLKIELEKAKDRLQSLTDRQAQFTETQKERNQQIREHTDRRLQLTQQRDESELAALRAESALASLFAKKEQIAQTISQASARRQKVVTARTRAQSRLKKIRQEAEHARQELHATQLEIERLELEQNIIVSRMKEDYAIELNEDYVLNSGFLNPRQEPCDTTELTPEITGEHDIESFTGENDEEDNPDIPEQIDHVSEEDILEEKIAALEANRHEIDELKQKLQNLGNVNLEAIETLESLESEYNLYFNQYNDLVGARNYILKLIEMMKNDSQRLFQETFDSVKIYFCDIFQQLFGGGHADLILESPESPLESGIEIAVRPPGKDLKSVMLMSGGEKTLTCIALLLAIFRHRTTPVCILDEVDAALDEANVGRFIKVVQSLQIDTQFLIITHSRKTMTCGKTMYGVTMQDPGVSSLVGVKFEDVGENGEILVRPGENVNGTQGVA